MKRTYCPSKSRFAAWLLLPLLLLLAGACGEDDAAYPSVKQDYLTADTDSRGCLLSLLTDEGRRLTVVDDRSHTLSSPDTTLRVVCSYEETAAADGSSGATIYALLTPVAPFPRPLESFGEEGVKSDPADMVSIWMGLDYLNVIVEVMAQSGRHKFAFAEEEVTTDAAEGRRTVKLLLYHDANDDVEAYTKRAYLSVPLRQYAEEGIREVEVHFSLHTRKAGLKSYQFLYQPVVR